MTEGPVPDTDGWQRLDPRMLLVHPVRELGRFLPFLIGIFVAGAATGGVVGRWQLVGVVVPVALGLLRYVTTSYRIAADRIELRRGLVDRHVLSTPVDRVRTVDITAPLVHRLLGLTSVRIGTGTASDDEDDQLDLDGLRADQARRLRADLLRLGSTADGPPTADPPPTLRLDPRWLRYAPLTSTGLVLAAGGLGIAAQLANRFDTFVIDTRRLSDGTGAWSLWVVLPLGLLAVLAAVALLSIGGYAVTNWGFSLGHTGPTPGGAWHLRRGLLTTHETTMDDARLHGVVVAEPLGLRLAGAARASAIVTGLDRRQRASALLVPPAPRDVVRRAAAEVLRTERPLAATLTGHGPRARTRRYTRAVAPALTLTLVVAALALLLDLPLWLPLVTAVSLPVAVALGADRAAALGHTLADGHLVVRSGSLYRRHEALETAGVIGWNLRSTWFQRRAGLTTLVATTAGGLQAVTAPDIPEPAAVEVALAATPGLLRQFVEPSA